MQSVGDRIRLLRIDRKLTQKELAEELGIGYSTVQGYEQDLNKLSKRGLRLLATFFNVSEDYILGNTKSKQPSEGNEQPIEVVAHVDDEVKGVSVQNALEIVDKLEKLIAMYKTGDITKEEYQRVKAKIIG